MLSEAAIITTDLAGCILSISREFRRETGYTHDELVGRPAKILRSPRHEDAFFSEVSGTLAAGLVWCGRLLNRRKDGTTFWTRCTISPSDWHEGRHRGYRATHVREPEGSSPSGHVLEKQGGLRTVFRASPDPQLVFDNGVVVDCNDACVALFDVAGSSALIGRTIVELSPARQPGGRPSAEASSELISRSMTEGTHRCPWTFCGGGGEFAVNLVLTAFRVGERCRLHARLERAGGPERDADGIDRGEALVAALQLTSDAVISISAGGRVRDINRAATRLLGCAREEAVGVALRDLFAIETVEGRQRVYPWEQREGGALDVPRHCGEFVFVPRDGEEMSIELSCAPLSSGDGDVDRIVVIRDVTNARVMAQQLTWQASHDPLTGLFNRREFRARLEALVRVAAQQRAAEHALLYLDLDQFKLINDTCGHAAGDALIVQISGLLRGRLRDADLLARLGGDEFGVILTDCPLAEARLVGKQLLDVLRAFRFAWEDKVYRVRASVGLTPITAASRDAAAVLSSADLACHMAKEKGRNRIWVHTGDEESRRRRGEMQWIQRIEKALGEDRLRLFYQEIRPTARLRGAGHGAPRRRVEVLVRLQGEDGELVPPVTFIPPAERYQVMSRIDRWVVDRTFAWIARRRAAGRDLPVFDINISGQSLGQDRFLDFVLDRLASYQLPPDRLCFEITETVAVSDVALARAFIDELVARGCEFALDDFGRGMSSFTYLKHLPVTLLKIDGSFVKNVRTDALDRAMVESVNHIGHIMGMQTIAEFVSDDETARVLEQIGVDWVQGFGIHRPAPIDELE